jgi:predicted DCC family thiol-disulfide oxidoreductase YuxK
MDRATILYDAECGFCRWSVRCVLAWDRRRRLRPVPLQAPEADALLPGMDHETRMASWHLVMPGGRVDSAGAAVAPLARLLPAGAPIALLASSLPRTTDRLYRWIAEHRGLLGRVLASPALSGIARPWRGERGLR